MTCPRCHLDLAGDSFHGSIQECLDTLVARHGVANRRLDAERKRRQSAERKLDEKRAKLETFNAERRRVFGTAADVPTRMATMEAIIRDQEAQIERLSNRVAFLLAEYERMFDDRIKRTLRTAV